MNGTRVTRRRVMRGAAGLFSLAALEVASLRGCFDHTRSAFRSREEVYRASMQRGLVEDGLVHLAHSTHVLCLDGARFLTDPWFYDPAFGALEHTTRPPVAPEAVGALTAILISHDHPDHADFRAIDRMDKRAEVVCATAALAEKARRAGFARAHVLGLWETLRIADVAITAVPAEHDAYEIGYVLTGKKHSVYFAGDTRLQRGIDEVGERYRLDLAILPVDGTRVKTSQLWVMTPDDAVVATRTLRPRAVMPSHAESTFCDPLVRHLLAREIPESAAKYAAAMQIALPNVACHLPGPGDFVALGAASG